MAKQGQPQNRGLCHLVPNCPPRVQEGDYSDMDKQFPNLLLIINEAVNESACYYWELSRDPRLYLSIAKSRKKKHK